RARSRGKRSVETSRYSTDLFNFKPPATSRFHVRRRRTCLRRSLSSSSLDIPEYTHPYPLLVPLQYLTPKSWKDPQASGLTIDSGPHRLFTPFQRGVPVRPMR